MELLMDLDQKKELAIAEAKKLYDYLVGLPKNVRPDDKERTGIRVVAWKPDTRNMFSASIYEPSEAAQFFAVEKAVRANLKGDHSSQNSRDTSKMRWSGCVSFVLDHAVEVFVSTSGLKEEEDVAIDIVVLSRIAGVSNSEVIANIEMYGGELPECFKQKDHYLYRALKL